MQNGGFDYDHTTDVSNCPAIDTGAMDKVFQDSGTKKWGKNLLDCAVWVVKSNHNQFNLLQMYK